MKISFNIALFILLISLIISRSTCAEVTQEAQIYFDSSIAGLIEAPKCFECHTSGGSAGFTRLVFLPAGANKNTYNAAQFDNLISLSSAQYILNKIKGVNHGGGQQFSEFSPGYQLFVTFFELLEQDFGDDDGDGVGNTADLCPNTPANTQVDNTGCEINSDLGTAWLTIPGSSCRATDPAVSLKLQSREAGLTNTSANPLQVICPIYAETHRELGDIADEWRISIIADNEGDSNFTLSCNGFQTEGQNTTQGVEKSKEVEALSSSTLVWDIIKFSGTKTYSVSCDLPPLGVIKKISIYLQ